MCKPQFGKDQNDVFIKVIANEPTDSPVAPSSVHKEQSVQVIKLANCVICTSDSLSAFFTSYTNTDMCLHYHRDIIRAITDGNCDPTAILFCKGNYVSLLFGTHSTADNAASKKSDLKESCAGEFVFHSVHQSRAINNDT